MAAILSAYTGSVGTVLSPSGDTTGVKDAAAINAAVAALPAHGGTVTLNPSANWNIICGTVVIARSGVYVNAPGAWINAVGTGDVFRMYDQVNNWVANGAYGGGITGFPVIDGTSAGAGSAAVHLGDLFQAVCEVRVQNFTGAASIGIHFDNAHFWTEQLYGRIFADNCTQHVVFDVTSPSTTVAAGSNTGEISTVAAWAFPSAGVLAVASSAQFPAGGGTVTVAASGPTTAIVTYTGTAAGQLTGCAYVSGSATGTVSTGGAVTLVTSSASFARADLGIYINQVTASNDGVVLQNGAVVYDGALAIRGNFVGSGSVLTSCLLRITGTVPAAHPGAANPAKIADTRLEIGAECASGTHTPTTIIRGSGSNGITNCYGLLDFGTDEAAANFTAAATIGILVPFMGTIRGDATLGTGGQGFQAGTAWNASGGLAMGNFTAATVITTGGTIDTSIPMRRVSEAGNVTGMILGGGSFDGQLLWIVNESNQTITFAASGTSNVADGVSDVIPALCARQYIFDGNDTNLWYRAA